MSFVAGTKLFVGGLDYRVDDQTLREHFSRYGEVEYVKIITDRDSGVSRGFGFVTFISNEAASSAIQGLDGQELNGRRLRVNYATEKPRGGGYNYGGGGGWQGGNGNYSAGGYPAGNYSGGGDGNYGGNVGWGSGGGGGGYGGGNEFSGGSSGSGNYAGGAGAGYGGGNEFSGGGSGGGSYSGGAGAGYGGGNSLRGGEGNGGYSDSSPNLSSILNDGPGGAHAGDQELVGGDGGEFGDGKDDFGDFGEGENSRDEDDYANNTRS
ncbi:Glycine-rich RNA-binding protein 3-mitochondrial [Striga hermonthica]|uniref:Glycine-rich RNA-binding protein 3-mitochondrial n=1 Tax=Striga hermonthica TaxID=68872 RepID=A0A9N7RGC2_STRHE|nr:Glycine-rich RNA-binding protein 3-mitochondrial [Striga hermonthica]